MFKQFTINKATFMNKNCDIDLIFIQNLCKKKLFYIPVISLFTKYLNLYNNFDNCFQAKAENSYEFLCT